MGFKRCIDEVIAEMENELPQPLARFLNARLPTEVPHPLVGD